MRHGACSADNGMIIDSAIGFLAGFIGALGLGGGGVLVMFLTVFMGVGQLKAQGINLLFFIPVGIFALIFHCRKKLVNWRIAVPAILCGLVGAAVGCLLATLFGAFVMRKLFGAMLLILGAWELFGRHKREENAK
jgi:uncharacterized protein